jgi:hypothetical protein
VRAVNIGDKVRIAGDTETARVECLYKDIEGGVRLDRKLCGFYSWNVADLRIVRRNHTKSPMTPRYTRE